MLKRATTLVVAIVFCALKMRLTFVSTATAAAAAAAAQQRFIQNQVTRAKR